MSTFNTKEYFNKINQKSETIYNHSSKGIICKNNMCNCKNKYILTNDKNDLIQSLCNYITEIYKVMY